MKRILALLLTVLLTFACAGSAETGTAAFTIDYHRAPEILTETVGERVINEACRTIDAFLAGKNSVVLEEYEVGDLPKIENALFVMCPPFTAYTWRGWDDFDDETKTFHWDNCLTDAERETAIRAFEAQVMTYYSDLQAGDTEFMKALSIYYKYVSTHVYDTERLEITGIDDHAESSYRDSSVYPIMEGKGYCNNNSAALAFLYTQAGINAVNVGGSSDSGNGDHAWDLVELDGKYYYMDATWDLTTEGGYPGFWYFGMTADERHDAGGYTLSGTLICANDRDSDITRYDITDGRFFELHYYPYNFIAGLTLDHKNLTITVTNADGVVTTLK